MTAQTAVESGMPGWAWWVLLGCLLALASFSVRQLIALPGIDRPGRLVLLLMSAGLGVGIALAVDDTHWFLGFVVGLAVVEIGPIVIDMLKQGAGAVVAIFRKKSGDL